MANLQESQTYEAGVYQLETTDPVVAGPEGISNLQAKQLASRTAWLKQQVDQLIADMGGLGIIDVSGLQSSLNSKLPSSNYTAADILAKLLTVDGNGSGVDADKVRGIPADFSRSLSSSGYQKLPGGLIIQWGGTVTSNGTGVVTFPLSFPNALLHASVCERNGSTTVYLTTMTSHWSLSSMQVHGVRTDIQAPWGDWSPAWLAIGF